MSIDITVAEAGAVSVTEATAGEVTITEVASATVAVTVADAGPAGPAGADGSPDTAAQVLTKLLTVDGAGSGLDADTVDGLHASAFDAAGDAVVMAIALGG